MTIKTAIMYVTLKGPVDLPTPGRLLLTMMDLPSELYSQLVTVYEKGDSFSLRNGAGLENVWGPWEFQGGLNPGLPFNANVSLGARSIAFGFCRPTMRFPTLKRDPHGSVSIRGTRSPRMTVFGFDGLLFQLEVYAGKRVRVMRRMRLGDTRAVYLSRTRPQEFGSNDKDWDIYYPPDVWQVMAECKFGRWRWKIKLPEKKNA